MKNETLTKTVEFPLAKLLREKGFEEKVKSYNQEGKLVNVSMTIRRLDPEKIYYPAPTIAEVLDWLFEEHAFCIYIKPVLNEDGDWVYRGYVKKISDFKAKEYQTKSSQEPIDSYTSAIEYTLKNLIK